MKHQDKLDGIEKLLIKREVKSHVTGFNHMSVSNEIAKLKEAIKEDDDSSVEYYYKIIMQHINKRTRVK